jgi:hypothetical protein
VCRKAWEFDSPPGHKTKFWAQEQCACAHCVGEENGGAMSSEYWASETASRWLARASGSKREAKPTLPPGTTFKNSLSGLFL